MQFWFYWFSTTIVPILLSSIYLLHPNNISAFNTVLLFCPAYCSIALHFWWHIYYVMYFYYLPSTYGSNLHSEVPTLPYNINMPASLLRFIYIASRTANWDMLWVLYYSFSNTIFFFITVWGTILPALPTLYKSRTFKGQMREPTSARSLWPLIIRLPKVWIWLWPNRQLLRIILPDQSLLK